MELISITKVLPETGHIIVENKKDNVQMGWLKSFIKLSLRCPELQSTYKLEDVIKETGTYLGVAWKTVDDRMIMWPIQSYSNKPKYNLHNMYSRMRNLDKENSLRKKESLDAIRSRARKIILNGNKISCNKQDAETLAKYFQDSEVMGALYMACINPFRKADDITSKLYKDIRDLIQGISWHQHTYEFCTATNWNTTTTNIVPLLDDLAKIKRNLKNNKQDENNKVHRKTEGKREREPRKRLRIPQRQKQIECGSRYPGNPRSTNYRRAQIRNADVCGRARYAGDPRDTEQHHRSEGGPQGIEGALKRPQVSTFVSPIAQAC